MQGECVHVLPLNEQVSKPRLDHPDRDMAIIEKLSKTLAVTRVTHTLDGSIKSYKLNTNLNKSLA